MKNFGTKGCLFDQFILKVMFFIVQPLNDLNWVKIYTSHKRIHGIIYCSRSVSKKFIIRGDVALIHQYLIKSNIKRECLYNLHPKHPIH